MITLDIRLKKPAFRLDVAFSLPSSGVTAVFGPSGSGKSTLLRCLAGLEPDVVGSIQVNDECWLSQSHQTPSFRRHIGYVFQQPNLFPHMSVRENLSYGSKRRGLSTGTSMATVIELMGLGDLLSRQSINLSGGEMQRIAIGRALMSSPRLLLLDEPLASLDLANKKKLIPFLENVFHHFDIPALYVTHSHDEVARLANWLVLMEEGRVSTYGSLSDLVARPDLLMAAADDAFVVLNCTISENQISGLTTLRSRGGEVFHMTGSHGSIGSAVRIRVQAKDVSLSLDRAEKTSILNIIPANIEEISAHIINGNRTIKLRLRGDDNLLARISDYSCQKLGLQPGHRLYAQIKTAALLY